MTLIKQEDAIDAVQTYLNILINSRRHGDDFTFINVLTEIRNKISALPSAEAEWIPVSERLPFVIEEDVLVTTTWGEVTIANRSFGDNWFIHEGNTNAKTSDIIAWTPLPMPYRKDGEA